VTQEINQIRKTSIWIFLLPVITLNVCLFITIRPEFLDNTIFYVEPFARSSFTIPYLDGGLSISRTARNYPTYLIFKPGMIITSILLIKYWQANNNLIKIINNEIKQNNRFLVFGILSAIFLIAHSIFLGIHFENDLYKFFRRFVLLAFIIFELIAQTLLVISLYKAKEKIFQITNKKILYIKIILVSGLIIAALVSLPFLVSSGHVHFKHALEWNYFIGIISFYLLTFLFWKENKT
tara:strand:- start:37 stop:747 length:711 start_codon:yes stop_codon:yes gene_type:complete